MSWMFERGGNRPYLSKMQKMTQQAKSTYVKNIKSIPVLLFGTHSLCCLASDDAFVFIGDGKPGRTASSLTEIT